MPQNWWDDDLANTTGTAPKPTDNSWWSDEVIDTSKIKNKTEEEQKAARAQWGKDLGRDVGLSVLTQAMTGPALIPSMIGQAAVGGGTSLYDSYKEKGSLSNLSKEDYIKAALKGGVSVLGPVGARILSPTLPAVASRPPIGALERRISDLAHYGGIESVPEHMMEKAARERGLDFLSHHVPEMVAKAAPTGGVPNSIRALGKGIAENSGSALAGGVLGHVIGGPIMGPIAGPLAGMAGGIAARNADKIIPAWWKSTYAHNPMAQAMLNIMAQQSGGKIGEWGTSN